MQQRGGRRRRHARPVAGRGLDTAQPRDRPAVAVDLAHDADADRTVDAGVLSNDRVVVGDRVRQV